MQTFSALGIQEFLENPLWQETSDTWAKISVPMVETEVSVNGNLPAYEMVSMGRGQGEDEEAMLIKNIDNGKAHTSDAMSSRTVDIFHSYFNCNWLKSRIRKNISVVFFQNKFNLLLPFGPAAALASSWNINEGFVFFFSLLGIAPLAERLGFLTEELSFYAGPTVGGLLNATFGNATEMIISIHALRNNMIRVVKQSLLGSILSNMLLVLGSAFLFGGVKNKKMQSFNKATAAVNSGLLLMAVMGLLFPTVLHFTHTEIHTGRSEMTLSRFSSCIMLTAYAFSLFFQLKNESDTSTSKKIDHHISTCALREVRNDSGDSEEDHAQLTFWEAILWLAIMTVFVSFLSGYLVDAIEAIGDIVLCFFLGPLIFRIPPSSCIL